MNEILQFSQTSNGFNENFYVMWNQDEPRNHLLSGNTLNTMEYVARNGATDNWDITKNRKDLEKESWD